jgi:hypothetical protein
MINDVEEVKKINDEIELYKKEQNDLINQTEKHKKEFAKQMKLNSKLIVSNPRDYKVTENLFFKFKCFLIKWLDYLKIYF